MSASMTRILLEASLAQTPEKSADPFAYSRRLLKEAAERGDGLGGIDNVAAAARMAAAARED
jgi:hypothetical protein